MDKKPYGSLPWSSLGQAVLDANGDEIGVAWNEKVPDQEAGRQDAVARAVKFAASDALLEACRKARCELMSRLEIGDDDGWASIRSLEDAIAKATPTP